jgi:RNA polymerase sigma factor (sigma-70 family)
MLNIAPQFASLIERLADGDDSAMNALIRVFGPAIERMAKTQLGPMLQSKDGADDVTQAVHLILWMGLRARKFAVATPRCYMALCHTLVARQVARQWRSAKVEPNITIEGNLMETIVDRDLFSQAHETGPSREMELVETLADFLDHLDPIDRQLVQLRLQGRTTVEVARILGLDPSGLRVRLSRLRKKFERELTSTLGIDRWRPS